MVILNKEKKISHALYSYHVSVLQVGIVLQQIPHHLNVSFLSCRDQCSPAVLYTASTCYSVHSHQISNPIDKASVKTMDGTSAANRHTYQLVIPGAHWNTVSHWQSRESQWSERETRVTTKWNDFLLFFGESEHKFKCAMCNSRLLVHEMLIRGVWAYACVCLSGTGTYMRECVRVLGLASEDIGCWLVSRSCHLVKKTKVKVGNKVSLRCHDGP